MAKPRWKRASVAASGGQSSNLSILDDHTLAKVLIAAKEVGTLSQWASLSKQLCQIARSRVPFQLSVYKQHQAGLIIRSHAYSRPSFSGCTELFLLAHDPAACCWAGGVLDVAQQWTALRELRLDILESFPQQQQQQEDEEEVEEEVQGGALEQYTSSLLMRVLPLRQQLRHLSLHAPALGACSAQLLLQLTQLTFLYLGASATPTPPAAAPVQTAAAELAALSGLTCLVELHLDWALAPPLPAGPGEPYCFPSSLVTLILSSRDHTSPVPMAHWLAHLPGSPQLQSLTLEYGQQQHVSAHPTHVARLLARHNRRLRSLGVYASGLPDWGGTVAGLAHAEEMPVGGELRPDDALAGLKSLRSLSGSFLCVRDEVDWQQLARLTALTKLGGATFHYAPPLQGGMPRLPLLDISTVKHTLDGHALGRLLLACPELRSASLYARAPPPTHVPAQAPALPRHPTLRNLSVGQCFRWGDAAAAAAQVAAVVPVASRVAQLNLGLWPAPSARGVPALPDLSACTALTALDFGNESAAGSPLAPHQEGFLYMVAPLVRLRKLCVQRTSWMTPQVALVLQYMLPQLQSVLMVGCGRLSGVAAAAGGAGQQQEEGEEG